MALVVRQYNTNLALTLKRVCFKPRSQVAKNTASMDIMDLVLKRGRDDPEERADEYQAPPPPLSNCIPKKTKMGKWVAAVGGSLSLFFFLSMNPKPRVE